MPFSYLLPRLQASRTTAHTLIVGAVCGVLLGAALWLGAPSLVAGQPLAFLLTHFTTEVVRP